MHAPQRKLFYGFRAPAALLIASLLWVAGCEDNDDSEPATGQDRGRIVSAEPLGPVSPALVEQLAQVSDFPIALNSAYTVAVYRVVYRTVDAHGTACDASGAAFLPLGAPAAPLISLQHGTETKRDAVASAMPVYYGLDALAMASEGFAACSPDYLGFGVSTGIHPYLHAEASAAAVVDFLRACRTLCGEKDQPLNGQVFLAGYSEGGFVTVAAQREIERHYAGEFQLAAVASLSGPYDLPGIVRRVLGEPEGRDPYFVAYFVTAYNAIYGWNMLPEIFRDPYAGQVSALFDGTHTSDEVSAALPGSLDGLLWGGFIQGYLNGGEPVVEDAVRRNSLLGWKPLAPLRLYHGTADPIVPYENAVTARDSFAAAGADVELVTLPGAGHESAIFDSIEPAHQWFAGLRR